MRFRQRTADQAGFTLLEVMVALAILGMGLTVIAQSQQAGMRQVLHSKLMTIATLLAREKMIEVEDELFEEGMSQFDEEQRDDFRDEGFDKFSYVLKVDKIELPASMDADALTSALGVDDEAESTGNDSSTGDRASGVAKLGASMLSQQFEIFRNVLQQSIRRVSLKVSWKEGTRPRSISVVSYFTDPRQVDVVTGGGGAAAPSGSSAQPTTGGSSGSTAASSGSGEGSR